MTILKGCSALQFLIICVFLLTGSDGSEEAQNQLLEEYFLQESVGEHPNIVKVILGGLFKGKSCVFLIAMYHG